MRILMLGNSFTFFHDMPKMLAAILPAQVVANVRGGAFLADQLRPQAGYADAMLTIWEAAAPAVHAQPLACAALIDALTEK